VARPVLLDLFCGAGGAAMGYARAGFRVIGVDRDHQPHYPFEFRRGNALCPPVSLRNVEAIHASPPCQAYSIANFIHGNTHADLVGATRELLTASGLPYIIENVPGAPLIDPVLVCGRALGLGVKRHRLFESNVSLVGTECPPGHPGHWVSVYGNSTMTRGGIVGRARNGSPRIARAHVGATLGRRAMGIDWMSRYELSQAIPPAYTELLGGQLMTAVNASARIPLI
jgi:DNA (cytosine-5)-methyltransferase 1